MATEQKTASKFARVRSVTAQVLKLREGQPRFLFLLSPMYVGKKLDDKKDPATCVHAVDMETGEEGILLCSAVMRSELIDAYGPSGYERKGFEVCVTRRAGGDVKFNHISISEVSVPDDFEPPKSVQLPAGTVMVTDTGRKTPADEAGEGGDGTSGKASGKARK
jgi:hypothetical protein